MRLRTSNGSKSARPREPSELNTETLTLAKPAQIAQQREFSSDSPVFEHQGGAIASVSKDPGIAGLGADWTSKESVRGR